MAISPSLIFFVISGYLFFANFKEWSWEGYKKKMRTRSNTLLVPYIIWNIACWFLLLAKQVAGIYLKGHTWEEFGDFLSNSWLHFLFEINKWGHTDYSWLPWTYYNSGPIDLPLWFLRDLIVVTALTPAVYWFVKKTKIWGIAILGIVFTFKLLPIIPGLSITSVFFFTLGAYLSINNYNLSELFSKGLKITLPLAIVVFTIRLYFIGNVDLHVIAHSIFIISATLASFGIASILIAKRNIEPNKMLISSCFFCLCIPRNT